MAKVVAKISDIVEMLNLENFTENIDLTDKVIKVSDVNRPGIQLAGYFEHFIQERVQLIGQVEAGYLESRPEAEKLERYRRLLSYDIPCIIFCRGIKPESQMVQIAEEYDVPILGTPRETSEFMSQLIHELTIILAPCVSVHGVLVDVYGEGLLLMGESGVGKSEAALELVRRGHRLVADDVVEMRKTGAQTLVGSSTPVTKYLIELRGIGIIDVRSLYGVESIKEAQKLNLIVKLEEWSNESIYDRVGNQDEYSEILGVKIVTHTIPIRPGRNIAVICETAAVNYRQKNMGYNATDELYRRVQANMENKSIF